MSNYLVRLRTDVWRTSSARYNAARRLRRKELFSTISLAFFSALTIALAVIQKIYSLEFKVIDGLDNYATALSILIGISIIVISLMEWGARNGSNADALFKNAEELNSLQRKIHLEILKASQADESGWDVAEKFLSCYEGIKNSCEINHTQLDDRYFLSKHRSSEEFAGCKIGPYKALSIALFWNLSSVWYYLVFWIVTAGAMFPIIKKIAGFSAVSCGFLSD
ncbi:SLATT domain-containing protein [Pseudomonas otitidis]|uniref:SLATT domain-containing protein n=1 Tax=Metapseudomonas otitidis TaxID=319939 RepID=UPI00244B5C5D|nr:SLATT domain-containing protein [Pseudomonas otitidis]MDH1108296.1 SLATT domain-containing protein [Pseudomonas otitidis]MDH1160486.1 SLATT domain-containing protein [Pseudomonas otitidis]MDH1165483.1 SLATT domain-containing protein [Pseudomonas otitidis]